MKDTTHADEMSRERFQQLVAAYGAKPRRWPEKERQAALHLLAGSAEAAQWYREASELDALLNQLPPHSPSARLQAVVLKGAVREIKPGWQEQLWPFGPLWKPMGALACSALLGLTLGLQTEWPLAVDAESTALLADEVIQMAYDTGWDGESG